MLNNIFKSVRVPEFRFKWVFWAEKGQQAPPKDKAAASEEYLTRPKPLGDQIVSVKEFYQHFNNIPVENLKLRDSIHLFHLGVKPVWEDPRNTRGGAWYFKVSKDLAAQFWHEMCLLAVGDVLQGAVETKRACKFYFQPFFVIVNFTDYAKLSMMTFVAFHTAFVGTRSRLPCGTAMQRTRKVARSYWRLFSTRFLRSCGRRRRIATGTRLTRSTRASLSSSERIMCRLWMTGEHSRIGMR